MIPFPLGDRVIVELDPKETITEGGIILPDQHNERLAQVQGTVVHTGETSDMKLREWVSPGDRVIVNKYQGTEHIEGEREYRILRGDDILAVLWGDEKVSNVYKERAND